MEFSRQHDWTVEHSAVTELNVSSPKWSHGENSHHLCQDPAQTVYINSTLLADKPAISDTSLSKTTVLTFEPTNCPLPQLCVTSF